MFFVRDLTLNPVNRSISLFAGIIPGSPNLIQAFFVLSPLPSSQARATITHSRRSAIYLSMSAMLEGSSMKPWVKRAPSSTTRRSSQSQPATLIPRCIRVDSATTARVEEWRINMFRGGGRMALFGFPREVR
jgi:hypothetical protein